MFRQNEQPEENEEGESDNEEIKSPKKRSKTETKERRKKHHGGETKNKHSAKNEPTVQEETGENDVDDIVEDFQFSDLDE